MAVSASTDFKSTAVQLLEDARSLLGVHSEEEQMEAYQLERGLRVMTKMLKAWEADGLASWLLTDGSFALVAADVDYVIGAGGSFTTVPFDFITDTVTLTRNSIDTPMNRMGRAEYKRIPNKASTGVPLNWFYDRQRDSGTFYVWPAPDATAGTVKFTYRRRIMDMDLGAENFDLPPEWEDAITKNLAYELIGPYAKAGTEIAKKVKEDAAVAYAIVKNFDIGESEGTVSIVPDHWGYR